MDINTKDIMSTKNPEITKLEADWNASEKVLVRAMVTREAADFLEEMAFKDFGMMKKGAVGLELTRLLLVAKTCLENREM